MKIGEVIRKYRKAKQMTQEEMASRLGVTTPAVNKWENGNTMPDITLLAPIARLLGVSLDELLSFRDELTTEEIRGILLEAEQKSAAESHDTVFRWIKEQIRQYPNCEALIHSLAQQLEGLLLIREIPENPEYDAFILDCYERLLSSNDESIRTAAADSLYGYYLRHKQYEKAETYLTFFSKQNPERKRKQALLHEKSGDLQKAFQIYEEILLADYHILSAVFNSLFMMELQAHHIEEAQYYAGKKKALAKLFEMGDYHIHSADLELAQEEKDSEQTLLCMQGVLDSIDTISAFTEARLYAHLTFKEPDPAFVNMARENLLDTCRTDECFAYMQNDPRWEELLSKYSGTRSEC